MQPKVSSRKKKKWVYVCHIMRKNRAYVGHITRINRSYVGNIMRRNNHRIVNRHSDGRQ